MATQLEILLYTSMGIGLVAIFVCIWAFLYEVVMTTITAASMLKFLTLKTPRNIRFWLLVVPAFAKHFADAFCNRGGVTLTTSYGIWKDIGDWRTWE